MSDGPEYLTVRELAELLRIKERKVYDLASSGAVPCTRATGKLLFSNAEIRAWLARESSGEAGGARNAPRAPIVLGSHDPLLDWSIRQSGCGLATYFDGSGDGLTRFAEGGGVAAGLHLFDAATGDWNRAPVATACANANAVLIRFAKRNRGLVLQRGADGAGGLAALRGKRIAPRQPGSGTVRLFEHLAARDGLALSEIILTDMARTETEAVQAVARGDADATFGLECIAADFNLPFLPLVEERYDLLLDRRAWFEPELQTLLAFFRSPEFSSRARGLGGYDVAEIGSVIWNA